MLKYERYPVKISRQNLFPDNFLIRPDEMSIGYDSIGFMGRTIYCRKTSKLLHIISHTRQFRLMDLKGIFFKLD